MITPRRQFFTHVAALVGGSAVISAAADDHVVLAFERDRVTPEMVRAEVEKALGIDLEPPTLRELIDLIERNHHEVLGEIMTVVDDLNQIKVVEL